MTRYITKMEYDHAVGYVVRLPDKIGNKFFAKKTFNGFKFALLAAIIWRDRQLNTVGQLHRLTNHYHRRPKLTSNRGKFSPIIGVCYQTHIAKNGSLSYGWSARFSVDKRQRTRFFSVGKYGHKRAFEQACAIRFQYCGKLMVKSRTPFKIKVPNEKCA